MNCLPTFLTHHFEADKGPFRNVCDMPEQEIGALIEKEQDAPTAFNRFALSKEFFRVRRLADDRLIEKYAQKFRRKPLARPYYAVLGQFEPVGAVLFDQLIVDAHWPWILLIFASGNGDFVLFAFKWIHGDGSIIEFSPEGWQSDDRAKINSLTAKSANLAHWPIIASAIRAWLRESCELIRLEVFRCEQPYPFSGAPRSAVFRHCKGL
jgi:hypothetical protein